MEWIPVTRKRINMQGLIMRRFQDGQIVENWDCPSMMAQLGLV